MSGIILSLAFTTIKGKSTQLTDNHTLQALSIILVLIGITGMNSKFGAIGYNPALASGYIMFETTQYDSPNNFFDNS